MNRYYRSKKKHEKKTEKSPPNGHTTPHNDWSPPATNPTQRNKSPIDQNK